MANFVASLYVVCALVFPVLGLALLRVFYAASPQKYAMFFETCLASPRHASLDAFVISENLTRHQGIASFRAIWR